MLIGRIHHPVATISCWIPPLNKTCVTKLINHSWVLYFLVFPNRFLFFFSFHLNHDMMIQERKHSKACRPSIKQISARVGMRHAARKTHIYKAYLGNALDPRLQLYE